MSVFLERLRAALDVDYEVMDELASGGMGVVYRARDRTLDRLVAIKIIRPDLATASMRERFLREARVLASFSHPNIVPVHRAGETDGMAYYVMDFLDGETLADRLRRGPLTADEFRMVANDLLAALEVVHEHGIVHRDVKPSNLFMTTGRAVLSDFGISKPASGDATGLTAPGHIVGTPGYMPPEQLAGSDVTVRTDIAAAAMVLFEACTGRPWSFDSHSDEADWSLVPGDAAPVMRRALAWAPSERIGSAGEFRAALGGRSTSRRPGTATALGALATLAAVVAWAIWHKPPAPTPSGAPLQVSVHQLAGDVGDSLASRLVAELRASADIEFRLDTGGATSPADFNVTGSLDRRGDSVAVELLARGKGTANAFPANATAPMRAAADSLTRALLLGLWQNQDTSLRGLPRQALPRNLPGLAAWVRAEALYGSARWTNADQAYQDAVLLDSSCALCDLRLMIISRWLRRTPDPALTARVVAALDRFTPPYRRLVLAGIETKDRWGALDDMARTSPAFELGQFVYGDELFHRGALAGRDRGEAIVRFQNVVNMRPGFAPAWAHLAWVAIAEGDSATGMAALAKYHGLAAQDDLESMVIQLLLDLGYAWRFRPAAAAIAGTEQGLSNPLINGFADLALGARYLAVFDAPTGVVWLGRQFELMGRADLRTPGLVAQVVGLLAQGKADSARTAIARLRGERMDAEYQLSAAEFETALVLFDSLDAKAARPRLDSALASLTDGSSATPAQRRRAAWMRILLARRAQAPEQPSWRALVAGERGLRPFGTLLAADSFAAARDTRHAIKMTEPLLSLDSAGIAGDPFFRSALHLMRATWLADAGDRDAAIRSLLWHENYDLVGHFDAVMEAADVDVAFGTVGRWYRARLMESGGQTGHGVCKAYRGAARLWDGGDPLYRTRAAQAREALERLHCGAS